MDEEREGVTEPVIERELAEQLDKYHGKWVAVDGTRLVAVGDSASEVLEAARQASVTDPLVFRVSSHPERIAFL